MEVFIGIDNGVSGALAALNKNGDVLYLSQLPLRKIGKDHALDVRAFQETLARFAPSSFVIAEQAQKFSPGKMALCSTWRCWGMIETPSGARGDAGDDRRIPKKPLRGRIHQLRKGAGHRHIPGRHLSTAATLLGIKGCCRTCEPTNY